MPTAIYKKNKSKYVDRKGISRKCGDHFRLILIKSVQNVFRYAPKTK